MTLHMKQPNTSIIQRQQTAVVEHPMTEDDLTHPALYRFKRNSLPCYTHHKSKANDKVNCNSSGDADWDLYPALIRNIENSGTPEQVEELHRMEHRI